MKSFSQIGQEQWVLEKLNNKRNGFFLDCGAADGIQFSNTYLLENFYRWNGILVEPNTSLYLDLVNNRKAYAENKVLYSSNQKISFIEGSLLGGIEDECSDEHKLWATSISYWDGFTTVEKECITPLELLEKYNAPKTIDYFSLDTEGSELSILKAFPWEKYNIRVLTVENKEEPQQSELRQFMKELGYIHEKFFEIDDFFVRDDLL